MYRLRILASQAQKGLWNHEVPESPLESDRLIWTAHDLNQSRNLQGALLFPTLFPLPDLPP